MSMMGEMTFFLGLQVNQSPCGIFIIQYNYVLEILKKYGIESCDPVGLWYTKDSAFELTGFLSADYAGCKDTFKSTFGGAQFLEEKLVSWSSKKQDCTALLTIEAEYVSLFACCAQVLWMQTQLTDYGLHFNKIPIYCDSKSAITISCNPLAAIQAQLNNLGREIKKVNDKVYATQVRCEQCKGPHYTKDCPLKEEGKTLEEAYYTVGEEKIVFTSVKPASSLIKRVYMLSLRERMEFDLEAMLMGETLVLNRSLAPFFEEYIEVNDLIEPIKLRRNQGDDLMPTIEEGEVIKEFRTRDNELDDGINDYPSYCDYDKNVHIDSAHNLKFSCMIGFEFRYTKFFPLLYVNVMSIKFYNSIIKDKIVYKGNNVVRALTNVPIFVRTFFVVMDFAVLKNIDAYRDEGIGDVIVGEPFLRDVGIKIRRFEGMITNYNGNNEVTYQMVQSHPRIKCHTNEQCNKIPPLLKVSDKDKMNGILHPYQKLKGFYKGVLNFGPDYTEDAKMEEWLTREHISVHEMK
nr:copia protein [Tanacetum cinerariifolium]